MWIIFHVMPVKPDDTDPSAAEWNPYLGSSVVVRVFLSGFLRARDMVLETILLIAGCSIAICVVVALVSALCSLLLRLACFVFELLCKLLCFLVCAAFACCVAASVVAFVSAAVPVLIGYAAEVLPVMVAFVSAAVPVLVGYAAEVLPVIVAVSAQGCFWCITKLAPIVAAGVQLGVGYVADACSLSVASPRLSVLIELLLFGLTFLWWSRGCSSTHMTLYHQTDPAAANAILRSGKMMRGSAGLAGAGIYFATSKQDTNHKAHQRGAYLECRVQVGKVKTVSANGDPSITCRSLRREGYDSVLIPRQNGHEYVVYDWAQVKSVRRV